MAFWVMVYGSGHEGVAILLAALVGGQIAGFGRQPYTTRYISPLGAPASAADNALLHSHSLVALGLSVGC